MQPQKKNPFDVSLCRFLYVVGIQSVLTNQPTDRAFFPPRRLFCRCALPTCGRATCRRAQSGRNASWGKLPDCQKRIHCAWEKGPVPAAGEFFLVIDHGNGLVTLYAHASAIYVTSGQKVAKGQTIAAVSNTGNSTGPHLHFEVHVGGTAVDPRDYICSFIDL